MNTILTDDEIQAKGRNGFGIDPILDGNLMKFARAVEAAVLAKLEQQWPVGFIHPQAVSRLENGETVAFRKVPYIGERQIPVFLRPVPQQADRQRVPDGWKLVPVEPTQEMLDAWQAAFHKQLHRRTNSRGKLKTHARFLESCEKVAYRAMLASAPEAPAQASAVDERTAFDRALSTKPEARFWNATDAMFWAWQARAALAQKGGE